MRQISLSHADLYRGDLILVNAAHACCPGEPIPLSPAREGSPVLLARRASTLLGALMAEIQGWEGIVPVSGWRSQNEQKRIYFDSLRENGEAFTRAFVALPGHSEHQTGLAIDLGRRQEDVDFLCPDFPCEGVCQRFLERAADYGFVLRYPAGKEAVTGIAHEPWHFRFVGAPHAGFLAREGLVLEEYIDLLREHPVGRPLRLSFRGQAVCVSFLDARALAQAQLLAPEGVPLGVSGNNADGFILTEWGEAHVRLAALRGA